MPPTDRGIGSEGLEQGGPSLGNDISRKDLGVKNAGDALTTPNTIGLGKDKENETNTVNMDNESSRGLTSTADDDDDDLMDDDVTDVELEEDDDLIDLAENEDEEDDALDEGI